VTQPSDFPSRFREAVTSGQNIVKTAEAGDTLMTYARSVAIGLSDDPKWLHCRFLYDAEGSRLFEAITEQPETLVELGSGYSVKTEHLLSAYTRGRASVRYIPVDVSESALRQAYHSVSGAFSDVEFTGINGTYGSALRILGQLSPQMVVFLGSTIGNLNEAETTAFWRSVTGHLPAGDFFLLGVDLVKDAALLEAAYNDAAGVTAQFTKNYATRMNRELGSQIDIAQIEHLAIWNPVRECMEISLRFRTAQDVYVEPLDQHFAIDAGELVLLEISRKFRLPKLIDELCRSGFEVRRTFTDENEWFALLLLERVEDVDTIRALATATDR
jgi:L-histidine N-alpha-methyltransferase